MGKIRTRETHRDIRTLDRAAVIGERLKNAGIRSRETAAQLSEEGRGTPEGYAGDRVEHTAEDGARDAARMAAEQGKALAVRGREAIRDRRSAGPDPGPTAEGTAPDSGTQMESGRLYAQRSANARASDGKRHPGTGEPSGGSRTETEDPVRTERASPVERGRELARTRGRIDAEKRRRDRDQRRPEGIPEDRVSTEPAVPSGSESGRSPQDRGRRHAGDRAKEARRMKRREEAAHRPVGTDASYRMLQGRAAGETRRVESGIRQKGRAVRGPAASPRTRDGTLFQGGRRFAGKPIRTAEQTSLEPVQIAQASTVSARRSAQIASAASRRSEQAVRRTGTAAAKAARTVKTAAAGTARVITAGARGLFAAAGGSVAVIAVVFLSLVALIAGSCFGVVFASEDSGTGLTMQTAVLQITGEVPDWIEKVKADYEGQYDKVELTGADSITNWPDVIAIYAVKTTTEEEAPEEVATMTTEKADRLRDVCRDMNPITARLVEGEEGTVLQITFTAKTYTDMMDAYEFSEEQRTMTEELMNSCLLDRYRNLTEPGAAEEGDFTAIEGTGGYIWPLQGYTRTSSPFGYRICPFHGRELHGGVDIPAPYGTPVHAAKSGRVVISTYGSSYGNYIVLAHGDGTRTLYAHMSARLVSVGQTVSQGQTIGRVGSTGSSTGNHLHFETWTGSTSGTRVNPMLYF